MPKLDKWYLQCGIWNYINDIFFILLNWDHGLVLLHHDNITSVYYFLWSCMSSFSKQVFFFFFFLTILFIFREGKGGTKRGWETSTCGCLSCAPYRAPGPQPRHVPWLGIEPATFWNILWHSIHWATLARATSRSLLLNVGILFSHGQIYQADVSLGSNLSS